MKNKKGFSLVELLVAMAIIAVLISIAAFGIQIVQRNSRNTMRRKQVDNLRLAVTEAELNMGQQISSMRINGDSIELLNSGVTVVGTYPINGFTLEALTTCDLLKEEDDSQNITLCYTSTSPREVGTDVEGSSIGFSISLGE